MFWPAPILRLLSQKAAKSSREYGWRYLSLLVAEVTGKEARPVSYEQSVREGDRPRLSKAKDPSWKAPGNAGLWLENVSVDSASLLFDTFIHFRYPTATCGLWQFKWHPLDRNVSSDETLSFESVLLWAPSLPAALQSLWLIEAKSTHYPVPRYGWKWTQNQSRVFSWVCNVSGCIV